MSTFIETVNLSPNDLGRDAWGRPKVINDRSLFHGMFTYGVSPNVWYETINGTITSGFPTNCTSSDGALKVLAGAAGNDDTFLRSFRNPRYRPNRGAIYSTAGWFDSPSALMVREFGTFTNEAGVFFRLTSAGLVGVIRTTTALGGTVDTEVPLTVPDGVDLSKGNVFDIQYQWRGVGNYKFFINLREVGNSQTLGTLTQLSMWNPALPAAFNSINNGANEAMYFGCVDVSTEGGGDNGQTYNSFGINNNEGSVEIDNLNDPVIAVRSKTTLNGRINTRDTLALAAQAYGDQRALFRVWTTRDFTAITEGNSAWEDIGDGALEGIRKADSAGTLAFNTAKAELVFGCRVQQDETFQTSALFEGKTDLYLTPGDMFVFTVHRENGAGMNGGVNFEFAEEI